MTTPEEFYVRLKPYDPKKGFKLKRYMYKDLRFSEDLGWYKITDARLAIELAKLRQDEYDYDSKPAFDVCTYEEAMDIQRRERRDARRATVQRANPELQGRREVDRAVRTGSTTTDDLPRPRVAREPDPEPEELDDERGDMARRRQREVDTGEVDSVRKSATPPIADGADPEDEVDEDSGRIDAVGRIPDEGITQDPEEEDEEDEDGEEVEDADLDDADVPDVSEAPAPQRVQPPQTPTRARPPAKAPTKARPPAKGPKPRPRG